MFNRSYKPYNLSNWIILRILLLSLIFSGITVLNVKAEEKVLSYTLEKYDSAGSWVSNNGAGPYTYNRRTNYYKTESLPSDKVDNINVKWTNNAVWLGPHGEGTEQRLNTCGLHIYHVEDGETTEIGDPSLYNTGEIYATAIECYIVSVTDNSTGAVEASYSAPTFSGFTYEGPDIAYFNDATSDLPAERDYYYNEHLTLVVAASNVASTEGYEWYMDDVLYQITNTGTLDLGIQKNMNLDEKKIYVKIKSPSGLTTQSTSCILKANKNTFTPKCSGNLTVVN